MRLLPMRLRVLPVLLALPLLAVPAAMLVFVCLSERRGVDGPQATEPADRVTGAAAPDGPPGVSDSLPRPAPDRPKSTGGRPPREPAREKRSERYPPAPPVDARFAVEATGRVLDPDGAPLEGAAVLALLQRSAMDVVRASAGGQATSRFSLAAETHTDVRGRFALAGLDPNRSHLVLVERRPFQAGIEPLTRLAFPGPARLGDIRLERGVTVIGTCRDGDGRPVAGARVLSYGSRAFEWWISGFEQTRISVADDVGAYRLEGLPPGRICLVARCEGRVAAARELEPVQAAQVLEGVDFVLRRGLRLAGKVVEPDGQGIGGARIVAIPLRPEGGFASASGETAVTDGQGNFVIDGISAGRWQLSAGQTGTRGTTARAMAGTTDIRLVLEPLRIFTVRGVVVVEGTGAPIAGARVGLGAEWVGREPVLEEATTVTDAAGAFRLEVAEQLSTRAVAACAEGFTARQGAAIELKKDSPEPSEVCIYLEPAARLSGRVTGPGGEGIDGAVATLLPASGKTRRALGTMASLHLGAPAPIPRAATDEAGGFEFGQVPAGEYVLEVRASGFAPKRLDGISLEPGRERAGVVLSLGVGGGFGGSVRFADGASACGYRIAVAGPDRWAETAHVGDAGEFAFEHLPPGGYRVAFYPPDRQPRRRPWITREIEAGEITIVEGGYVERSFTIERGVRVHGTVRLMGMPSAGCTVKLKPVGSGDGTLRAPMAPVQACEARTDSSGAYSITDVPAGTARASVLVKHPSYSVLALEREVTVPRQPDWRLDLDLPGGAVRGRVLFPPGVGADRGLPLLRLTSAKQPKLRREAFAAADGTFVFDLLQPGDYVVHVFADQDWGAAERPVKVGLDVVVTGVEIPLMTGVRVSGVVVDERGEPAELAEMRVRPAGPVDGRGTIELRSGAYGKFTIPAIQPGRYTFFAETGTLQSDSIEITVPPGGRDDIRVVVRSVRN